jgi:hypothetical protein
MNMLPEISAGMNVMRSFLDKKIPQEKLDCFSSTLSAILQSRFAGHWRPTQPLQGNAYRSIHTTTDKIDPVLRAAADQASISEEDLLSALPFSLTLWIDPSEVRPALHVGLFARTHWASRRSYPSCDTEIQNSNPFVHPPPSSAHVLFFFLRCHTALACTAPSAGRRSTKRSP